MLGTTVPCTVLLRFALCKISLGHFKSCVSTEYECEVFSRPITMGPPAPIKGGPRGLVATVLETPPDTE